MKASPVVLLILLLLAGSALAETPAKAPLEMKPCCIEAAQADKGCCGKDAETLKAAYAEFKATKGIKVEMHDCCQAALAEGKGCCGMDAEALKASFDKKLAKAHAACEMKTADSASAKKASAGCDPKCSAKAKASCGAKAKKKGI